MYRNIFLTFALFSTTVSVQAMQYEADEQERTVIRVTHEGLRAVAIQGSPEERMSTQRKIASDLTSKLLNNLEEPKPEICRKILAAHEEYKKALAEVQLNIKFTSKYISQMHRSCALANYFIGRDLKNQKTLTLEEALKYYEATIFQCRSHLKFLNADLGKNADGEATREVMTYILADSLMESCMTLTKSPMERYEHAREAGKLYEDIDMPQLAYFAYSNAYEFLIAHDSRNKELMGQLKSKLVLLYPTLDETYKPHAQIQRRLRQTDDRSKKYNVRALRVGRRESRMYLEEMADSFLHAARADFDLKMRERCVGNYLQAAKHYFRAVAFAPVAAKKEDLMQKAAECMRNFEEGAGKLLATVSQDPIEGLEAVRAVYTKYYTSQFQANIGVSPLVDLKQFISACLYTGDFEGAKIRCEVLCTLEEKAGSLSESTKFLRMKVNALHGDLSEFISYVEQKKVEAEKQKAKKREKREKQKAKHLAKIQEEKAKAEQKAAAAVEHIVKLPAVQPKSKVNDEESEPDVTSFEVERPKNLASEYRNQEIRKKEKTTGPAAPAVVPQVCDEAESPKLVKKVVPPKLFEMCRHLLSGGRSLSRDDVLKLFADLNCEINETRGKGSHAIIRYVTDREGSVVGCLPEFEEKRIEEEDDVEAVETQQGSNITMTVPKDWGKQMHPYMAKALKDMLVKMGYTLETIEQDKTQAQSQKKSKPAAAGKKKTSKKKKK